VSKTMGSPFGELSFPSCSAETVNPNTVLDIYVRASISGNSLAAEFGHCDNNDETTFSLSPNDSSMSEESSDEADIHYQALVAILEVVTANSNASFEYVCAPEPQGGVQEWWARMLSGSLNNSQSASGCPAIGESL
jgi:hypothetical protein